MSSASKLTETVILASRMESNPDAPNDYGNVTAGWQDEGEVPAEFIQIRGGGETIIAGRLQGRHPQIVRVRAMELTERINTDWMVVDAKRGTEFAVRDVTFSPDRAFVDLLCESGVAA